MPHPHARPRAGLLVGLLAVTVMAVTPRCAKSQCELNSDCLLHHYCNPARLCATDCILDRDCVAGYCDPNGRCVASARADAGPDDAPDDAPDAGGTDAADDAMDAPTAPDIAALDLEPMDTPVMDAPPVVDTAPVEVAPPDTAPPPVDVPRRGVGVYLDPCATDDDCGAGLACLAGLGGARFCSRACAARGDCASEHLCVGGRCVPDDTGAPCTVSRPVCRQACFGTSLRTHCTHECASAADCPAGFACGDSTTGTTRYCVEIEVPGSTGCPGRYVNPTTGCTAGCRTAADCPQRFAALPAYTCESAGGGPRVCVAPADVFGSDPMGAACTPPPMTTTCRSAVCDDSLTPPQCMQACSLDRGCPAGWACRTTTAPDDLGNYYFVCRRAGTDPAGAPCRVGAGTCASAMCRVAADGDTTGYCTRVCNDGYCPTGMACQDSGAVIFGGIRLHTCVRM